MSLARKLLIVVLLGIAALVTAKAALLADDGSESSGGTLTGSFILSALLAPIPLLTGAFMTAFGSARSRIAIWIGWLLALPWTTWLLFPGAWCANGNCAGEYPVFTPNLPGLAMALLPALALALQRWPSPR